MSGRKNRKDLSLYVHSKGTGGKRPHTSHKQTEKADLSMKGWWSIVRLIAVCLYQGSLPPPCTVNKSNVTYRLGSSVVRAPVMNLGESRVRILVQSFYVLYQGPRSETFRGCTRILQDFTGPYRAQITRVYPWPCQPRPVTGHSPRPLFQYPHICVCTWYISPQTTHVGYLILIGSPEYSLYRL